MCSESGGNQRAKSRGQSWTEEPRGESIGHADADYGWLWPALSDTFNLCKALRTERCGQRLLKCQSSTGRNCNWDDAYLFVLLLHIWCPGLDDRILRWQTPGSDTGCEVFFVPEEGQSMPCEYFMAGTTCKDWSSMGTCQTLTGHSVIPFSIELQLVKRPAPVDPCRPHTSPNTCWYIELLERVVFFW